KVKKGSEADDLQASSQSLVDAATDPTIPTEWVPPNASVPILDLVDVIFQLHDGEWIRRKAFWVTKHVLQLGMGDAFDDWLIEKIQVLRRGTVVASGIRKIEQVIVDNLLELNKAPAALVGLIGRKEYEHCAKEQIQVVRLFLVVVCSKLGVVALLLMQSSVGLKHLTFDLLEVLLLSAFPGDGLCFPAIA
ncbi:Glucan 1,3-beta-glucosidase A precursor, partial [Actinidia chinensis var. chinensis]